MLSTFFQFVIIMGVTLNSNLLRVIFLGALLNRYAILMPQADNNDSHQADWFSVVQKLLKCFVSIKQI